MNLVAVADVVLSAPVGVEPQLDSFYVGLLGFEKDDCAAAEAELGPAAKGLAGPVYRAENFRLRFEVFEADRLPPREDFRSTGVVVPDLTELRRRLDAAEIQYARQKSMDPGRDALLFLDPAGNYVQAIEIRRVM